LPTFGVQAFVATVLTSSSRVALRGVAAYLPPQQRSSGQVEALIAQSSPKLRVPRGIVELMTGIRCRRVAADDVNASDLAAEAGRRVLDKTGVDAADVDLLIYASVSQDLLEPATANIVQEKVGTRCPVFDLKNACNSFLNALQVAEALIQNGTYRTILVTVGELPSRCIKWSLRNREDLRLSFPGYTLGDAGAAALLQPSDNGLGIFYRSFKSASRFWDLGVIPGGGSMHPRGDEWTYIQGDGTRLKDAFFEVGPAILHDALAATGTICADYQRVLVHQVSMPFIRMFLDLSGVPRNKIVVTLPELGNMGAASLPVAFALAEERGEISRGDRLMWIGLAGGISMGVMLMDY
jgi:3-oxoacyl-[acyl-carrier-protein] synthase-3